MTIVTWLIASVISGLAARKAVRVLLPRFPLRRSNYRGVFVTTSMGIAIVFGVMIAAGVIALGAEISPSQIALGAWVAPLAALAGFAAIGFFDDVISTFDDSKERGFSGHLNALAHGKVTSGGIKLITGATLSFAIAVPLTQSKGFVYALLGGIIIALSANLSNSFDLRPGRSCKVFLVAAVPLAIISGAERGVVLTGIAAVIAFLPFDLRERAMLGDAGSNAIGALLGACIVASSSRMTLFLVAMVFVVMQLLAETVTLSAVIESIPFLRIADRWGRVTDPFENRLISNEH